MNKVARITDKIRGMTSGEHAGHAPGHPPLPLTGYISEGSPNVFVNKKAFARKGDTTTEFDDCCGQDEGKIREGSSIVFVNGIPASRIYNEIDPHSGHAKIIEGSPNVFLVD